MRGTNTISVLLRSYSRTVDGLGFVNGSERRRLFDSIFRQVVAKHLPFAEEADFTNDCSIFVAVLDLRDGQVP